MRIVDAPVARRPPAEPPPAPGRRRRLAIVAAVVLTLAVAAVFGKGGLFDAHRYRQERDRLHAEIARLEAESARLEDELRSLAKDDSAIERIAREELSLARPGELLVLLPESTPP